MTKQIFAVLVSAVLLFLWQFLSWSMLGIHQDEYKYTPNQDKILEALNANLSENGDYFLPGVAPGTPMDQEQAFMESQAGKPWAKISYRKAFNTNMGMNLFRGFVADLAAAFLLVWLLMKAEKRSFSSAMLSSLAVGFIGYLTIPYLDSIWYETKSIGFLIDSVVQWGLVGVWLGWWLPKR